MNDIFESDVVVVGAGTAGTYFAWQAAREGVRVLLLEARALDMLGTNIEVIHMDQKAFAEFGVPEPQPPELIHLETTGVMWAPDRNITDIVEHPFYVLNMPAFYAGCTDMQLKAGLRSSRMPMSPI